VSLVTAIRVSLSFQERQIFREVGFLVEPGSRIGLVGPNGSGKTTLLRLLRGEINPDSGEIRISKGIRIGYLPQDVYETLAGPLLNSVINSIPGRIRLEHDLRRAEQNLNDAYHKQEQASHAKRIAEIHQKINTLEVRFPRYEAEKILAGLGFKESDFGRSVSSLSGGWKMRAALASLLYQNPELLLLDEPTNHLDIPSIKWLELFLQEYKGAMILVSHDRYFLNRQIHRILSFEPDGLKSYNGDYDSYSKVRGDERRRLEAIARNQAQKIKEARKFINRFRAKASKARQAQSKIKLVKKIELVEGPGKEKTIHFAFPEVPRSGRVVVSIEGVSKGFNGATLYEDLNLAVMRGERIAIIGPNGSGKTTLLKLVAGEIQPDKGKISLGHKVTLGYFAQHHVEMLDPRKTILQEVSQVVPDETTGFVRGVCGAFLFSGADVDKVIGVISGGERARVSLAKLLVKPGNLMVLDEPTNHLDILSSETLIDALDGYNGTLLFVSHNESFINRLATKIWDIRKGGIMEYPGNLDEYYDHLIRTNRLAGSREEKGNTSAQAQKAPDRQGHSRKAQKRQRAERRRLIHDTLKPLLDRVQDLEKRIAQFELRQKDLEKRLADPKVFRDKDRSVPLLNEFHDIKNTLDELLMKWEQGQDELESTKRDLGVQTMIHQATSLTNFYEAVKVDMKINEQHKALLKKLGLKDEDFDRFDGEFVRYEYHDKKGVRLYDPYYRTSYKEYIDIDGWSAWSQEKIPS